MFFSHEISPHQQMGFCMILLYFASKQKINKRKTPSAVVDWGFLPQNCHISPLLVGENLQDLESVRMLGDSQKHDSFYPIPSMGLVYLPTWMVDFYGFHVGKYTVRPMDGMGIDTLGCLIWWLAPSKNNWEFHVRYFYLGMIRNWVRYLDVVGINGL